MLQPPGHAAVHQSNKRYKNSATFCCFISGRHQGHKGFIAADNTFHSLKKKYSKGLFSGLKTFFMMFSWRSNFANFVLNISQKFIYLCGVSSHKTIFNIQNPTSSRQKTYTFNVSDRKLLNSLQNKNTFFVGNLHDLYISALPDSP